MQTTDERCNDLAKRALMSAELLDTLPDRHDEETMFFCAGLYEEAVIDDANTIIAERTRELAAQDGAK